ncbi:MAG: molybdate ABC transporter substrate-binding protein [Sphaerobacter sp.]|nr:molybdate ABC transporter substrate-binding protein [Sphaerobacter sp.]
MGQRSVRSTAAGSRGARGLSGIAVLGAVLVTLILAACGAGSSEPTEGSTPTSAAVTATGTTAAASAAASPTNAATATAASPAASPAAGNVTGELTVFAAASLTDAFQEIGAQLEAAHPGLHIAFNFAGSQALRAQLAQGARADVFAAADEVTMQGAQAEGSIADAPRIFAANRLVVILPPANPGGVQTLRDLARPGLKLVLADERVPVGRYARQMLQQMAQDPAFGAGFADQVLGNVVSNEANVKQVVAKVQLGETDAGIVYATDVTPALRDAVTVIEIPAEHNVVARYPIAVVTDARNPAAARAFIDAVTSAAGQAILARFGFQPVTAGGRP